MNWHILISLFLSGIILGSSVCTVSCGWIFLPFVLEQKQNIKKGLSKFFLFHAGKIVSYTAIGGLIGYSTAIVSSFKYSRISLFTGAGFFFFLGILNFLMPEKFLTGLRGKLACFSGFITALVPCGALAGVFVYIGYVANNFLQGALAGFVFGTGNMINPLILITIFSPACSRWIEKFAKNTLVYKICISAVFILWSLGLLWRALG